MSTITKISPITQTALSGLQKASLSINETAAKIAQGGDQISADNFIQIRQAENSFKANAAVIKVDKELEDAVLDLIA